MLARAVSFLKAGAANPDVEFLSATSVAASDGTNTLTALSGSYTPHASADFVLAAMMGRVGATAVSGAAMSLNGVSMGTVLSTDSALTSLPTLHVFGTSTFAAGTLAFTRTNGTFFNAQLFGASFRFVDSVGTPVKVSDAVGASPAQATITPTTIGDMLVVIVCIENSPTADGELTAVNCTERLDLIAPDATTAERTICGLGTLLADVVAAETLGFSFGGIPDNWTCHAIPLRKAV